MEVNGAYIIYVCIPRGRVGKVCAYIYIPFAERVNAHDNAKNQGVYNQLV